jgi:hypothetical protein
MKRPQLLTGFLLVLGLVLTLALVFVAVAMHLPADALSRAVS